MWHNHSFRALLAGVGLLALLVLWRGSMVIEGALPRRGDLPPRTDGWRREAPQGPFSSRGRTSRETQGLPAQEPANPPASDSAGSVPLALQELWALSKAPAEQAESKARVLRATYLRNVLLKTVDAELDKLAAPYAAKLPEAGDEGPSAFPAGGLPLLLDAISRVEQAAGWLPDTAKKCAQVRERAHGIVSGATALSAWGAAYRNEFWRGFWAGPSREHLTIIAYLAYAADSYPGALAGCSESDLFVSVPDADWWDVVYALGRVPVKGRARLAVSVSKERKVLQSVDYTEVLSGSPHSFSRDQVTVTVRLIRDGQTVWQRSAAGADPNWRVPLPGSLRVADRKSVV